MINEKRAFFLDRDGVINIDHGYVHRPDQFDFIEYIFELCHKAVDYNYLLIVVTNQAGIGRGYYTEQSFLALNKWMLQQFKTKGIPIADVLYCPHHPKHGVGQYKKDSFDRKPNPGMLLSAKNKYALDLDRSIMIGDKDSDMLAAKKAGVGIRCHYLDALNKSNESDSATHIIHKLYEATSLITNDGCI